MSTFERQPENIADAMGRDRMFATTTDGKPITRESKCECGQRFVQRLLSERFLEIVERSSRTAMAVMERQVPGFYVPVHCPPCERQDLGRQARVADLRLLPSHHERPEAAD